MTSASTNRPITLDDLGDRPIRLVTFDLYDTLVELKPRRWERLGSALERTGYPADLEALKIGDVAGEHYYTIENGRYPIRDRTPDEQHAFRIEHLRQWLEASGVTLDAGELEAVYGHYRGEFDVHAQGGAYGAFPEVVPALVRLREAGVKRAVISNADADVTEFCGRMAFAQEMDAIITSAIVGWEKPDPRTFHAALEHPAIQVAPEDAIHVGDQPMSDVIGSIAIGMRAALIDRYHRQDDAKGAVVVSTLLSLSDAVVRHNAKLAATT
ncbi:MAG TPA: HAD family hydrolase [Thermomicrobiales bacterium]|jgi:putative hydrolase of the HAD superfamily|nr:HAD family hydrolase [Thermomicrobiales bacterium]